jgi:hypothetical protein
MKSAFCLVLALTVVPSDSSAEITGPVAAYAFDAPTGNIRAINGVPGSTVLGDPLPAPALRLAALHPAGQWLLGVATDSRMTVIGRNLGGASIEWKTLEGTLSAVDAIELSSSGARALLYSSQSGEIQLVTGLPAMPELSAAVSISDLGELSAAAVAPNLDEAVLATGRGLYRIAFRGGEAAVPQFVGPASTPLTFGEDGSRLFIANAGSVAAFSGDGTLLGLSAPVIQPDDLRPPSEAGPATQLSALCAGAGNVAAIQNGSNIAVVFDASTLERRSELTLPARSVRCSSLGGGSFLLADSNGSPVGIMDLQQSVAYFVPAASAPLQ